MITDEQAKAITAVAKTADHFLDIICPLLKQICGLGADELNRLRQRLMISALEKTQQNIQKKNIQIRYVSPKLVIPLLAAASLEENDELHTKWANLLTNAMDSNYNEVINRSYIDILEQLAPIDAQILDFICNHFNKAKTELRNSLIWDYSLGFELGHAQEATEISFTNLIRLGCLRLKVISQGQMASGMNFPNDLNTNTVGPTALGLAFHKAIN